MKTRKLNLKKLAVLGSTSVFTLLAVPLVADLALDDSRVFLTTVQAADVAPTGTSRGGQGGTSGGAQQGQGGSSSGAGRTTDATGAGQAASQGGTTGGAQQGQGASTSGGTSGASSKGQGAPSGGASKATDGAATSGTGSMGSGVRGQGTSQDNKQSGGSSAPGPGGINNEPNDAKGPRFSGGGAGTAGSAGGKPAWAQEGLPTNPDGTEVELGRLNVVRAPGKLLDKQLIEATAALADLVAGGGSLYQSIDLAAALALISQDVVRVDSPLANLALLKDFLSDGVIDGNYVTTDGTTNQLLDPAMPDADFVSLLLGSAADKTVPITVGTVGAMEVLLGLDLGDNAAIAESADAVREAILDAHED